MGANSTRVPSILVTNQVIDNVAASVAAITADELLIVNRGNTILTGTPTQTSAFENDVFRIALGTGAAGVVKWSAPIHLKHVRKVTKLIYEVPVQHRVVLSQASLGTITTGKVYSIKVRFHDTNRVMADKETCQYFTYTTTAAATTAALVYTDIAAVINGIATANKQIIASVVGSTLQLDGLAVADNALGAPQFRYFEVALRKGFTYAAGTSVVVTEGKPGRGTSAQVKEVELDDKYAFNRTQFPVDTDTRRATATGTYNCVVIEHGTPHLSVHHSQYVAPQSTVVYFQTSTLANGIIVGGALVSQKQTTFLLILKSLVESAGVFVQ